MGVVYWPGLWGPHVPTKNGVDTNWMTVSLFLALPGKWDKSYLEDHCT